MPGVHFWGCCRIAVATAVGRIFGVGSSFFVG